MPRFSKRAQYIRQLKKSCAKRAEFALARWFFDDEDEDQDLLDVALHTRLVQARNSRYLFRGPYRKRRNLKEEVEKEFLDDTQSFLNDEEFLLEFRVSRTSFALLCDLIKDDPVFKRKGPKGAHPAPVEWQLLVFLRYLGCRGDACSNGRLKNFFRRCGKGSIEHWRDNVESAILKLRPLAITWPDARERKRIAKRFNKKYGFRNCVFIIDGTLFPLTEKPQTEDYSDYYGRKLGYTINAVILCDDKRRIRYYLAGNPGSCHDQRARRQTPVYKNPEEFLDLTQYGIGDSAFDPDWFMVSAFSKPSGAAMERLKQMFNDKLAKPRVISEHVNGILKGRFPILNALPQVIQDKKTLKECLRTIDCCIILHNLLVGMRYSAKTKNKKQHAYPGYETSVSGTVST